MLRTINLSEDTSEGPDGKCRPATDVERFQGSGGACFPFLGGVRFVVFIDVSGVQNIFGVSVLTVSLRLIFTCKTRYL